MLKKIVIVLIVVLVIVALAGCVQDSGNSSPTNNPNMTLVTEKIIVAGQNGIINQGGANQSDIDVIPKDVNLSLGVSLLSIKADDVSSGTISVYYPNSLLMGKEWINFDNAGIVFELINGTDYNHPISVSDFKVQCSSNFTGAIEIDLAQYVPISGASN